MYVIIAGGGFYIFIQVGFAKYIPGPYIAGYHKILGSIFMLLGYISFLLASWTNPGIVKKSNYKESLKRFEFDDMMFIKKEECRTCKLPKPARSKHCSLCNVCV